MKKLAHIISALFCGWMIVSGNVTGWCLYVLAGLVVWIELDKVIELERKEKARKTCRVDERIQRKQTDTLNTRECG